MKKKFFVTLVLCMILSSSVFAYANPLLNKENKIPAGAVVELEEGFKADSGFVNKPKDFEVTTTKETVVISGTGKENDIVKISLFKRSGDAYVPMNEVIELKIGQLGVFTKEVSIKETNKKTPSASVISKDTLVVLELKRGDSSVWDYRLVSFADDNQVKQSLQNVRSNALVINK